MNSEPITMLSSYQHISPLWPISSPCTFETGWRQCITLSETYLALKDETSFKNKISNNSNSLTSSNIQYSNVLNCVVCFKIVGFLNQDPKKTSTQGLHVAFDLSLLSQDVFSGQTSFLSRLACNWEVPGRKALAVYTPLVFRAWFWLWGSGRAQGPLLLEGQILQPGEHRLEFCQKDSVHCIFTSRNGTYQLVSRVQRYVQHSHCSIVCCSKTPQIIWRSFSRTQIRYLVSNHIMVCIFFFKRRW